MALLLAGVQGATTPLILARHEEPTTRDELERIFRLFSAGALIAFLVVSLFADTEIRVLASAHYARAEILVPYLFMSALLFGIYIFAPGLTIVKRTGTFAWISVSAGVLNLGVALALVPSLGIRGAGIATVTSSAWFFVLTMVFSQRHYAVAHDWGRLGGALAVAVGLVVLARAVIPTGHANAFAAWPLLANAALALSGSIAVLALLVRRDELVLIWRVLRRPLSGARRASLQARTHRSSRARSRAMTRARAVARVREPRRRPLAQRHPLLVHRHDRIRDRLGIRARRHQAVDVLLDQLRGRVVLAATTMLGVPLAADSTTTIP